MKLSQAAQALGATLQGDDQTYTGVSIDSRTLQAGELFIALRGPNFDGHDYLQDAADKGAAGAIVSQDQPTTKLPVIKVNDTQQALTDLAIYQHQCFPVPAIAVTGSCGKTTVRALLDSIFSQLGKTLASKKSFNNEIGVPLTLLDLDASYQYAVCELGANHVGEIARLTHMVKPTVAIITMAAPVHIEGFGSLEGVACGKGEIFQGLPADGTAVINHDDQYADYWRKLVGSKKIITFGLSAGSDVSATDIEFTSNSMPRFQLVTLQGAVAVQLNLMGEHNIMNALAAAAAAQAFNCPLEKIKLGLEATTAVGGRLVEKVGFAGATIIDDSYNANPASIRAAISILTSRQGDSILVLGDMLELGEQQDQIHHDIGVAAAEAGVKQLFCYGDLMRHAVKAFGQGGQHFASHAELINALKPSLNQQVTVLVKGSRSMQMEKISNAIMNEV